MPLELLFSGTVFYSGDDGRLQTARIGWESEAEHRLPVRVWRELMETYFPDTSWLRLRKGTMDKLRAYKSRRALPSFETALDELLEE